MWIAAGNGRSYRTPNLHLTREQAINGSRDQMHERHYLRPERSALNYTCMKFFRESLIPHCPEISFSFEGPSPVQRNSPAPVTGLGRQGCEESRFGQNRVTNPAWAFGLRAPRALLSIQVPLQIVGAEAVRKRSLACDPHGAHQLSQRLFHGHHAFGAADRNLRA